MFNINHIAISVSNLKKSEDFYKLFGFKEKQFYESEDKSFRIEKLEANGQVLELWNYTNHKKIPRTAMELYSDLPINGVKHFALGVSNIQKAKDFILKNKINMPIDIKAGRLGKSYFFINDPDGILIEIIEN